MGVGRVPRTHLLNGRCKQERLAEDVGILGEEAEDQTRHEMVHVAPALGRAPFGIVLQKLDIEPVQTAGGPDVERAFAELFDRGDAGERQKETEMVGEVGIGASDGLAGRQILGLEGVSIGRQNVLRLGSGGRRAGLQRGKRLRDLARRATEIWMLFV